MENCVDIEKFEDTRRGKSKKDRKYNGHNAMDKETNNEQQNTTQKTTFSIQSCRSCYATQKAIDFATRTPQTNGGESSHVNILSALKFF